jgi:hypothetical protein
MLDFIMLEVNHFGTLHNGRTIIFSHINHLAETFREISSLNNEVILITGNDDVPVCDQFVDICPSNVKYWFAQNHLTPRNNIFSIPIGLSNTFANVRPEHGIGWHQLTELIPKLTQIYLHDKSIPSKFIYANFNENTNTSQRSHIKRHCQSLDYINFKEPILPPNSRHYDKLSYNEFFADILEHEAVVCPAGNGIDTHRLWETLYCKRIPITIKLKNTRSNGYYIPEQKNEYEIYKLYSKLPIVMLDSDEELFDKNHLKSLINIQKQKSFDANLLNFSYWKEKILNLEKTLNKGI